MKLRAVPMTQVEVNDGFWKPRLDTNREVTLPHNLDQCEQTGRISNFAKAGKLMEGQYEGALFNDSDVYKVLEGAAYCLTLHPDPALEAQIDAIIDKMAASQQPDGYINSFYTMNKPDQRWTNLKDDHELYCAGHMFEAAVAYADATGKTKLLDVARRKADLIDSIFGRDKRIGAPGHEEIELALLKLWRKTGEERYRKLAEFFIDIRGQGDAKTDEYHQAHKPVKEQDEIVGHAVRALYLYCGVADVAALTGDKAYIDNMETIWQDVAYRKLYITGGVGARHHGESFGKVYELPNDSAYAETCAGIALALWNHRLLLMHGEARFADVLERELYNAFASSVSLAGDKFFYVNPLASNGQHRRKPWYGCACCPTNIVRIMPQVLSYIYAQTDDDIYVNLYVAGDVRVSLASGDVRISQETDYPWNGRVKMTVSPADAAEFAINLRLPDWCEDPSISIEGKKLANVDVKDGYARLARRWKPGDVVELDMPMPIQRIQAHPSVEADRGKVALQRGPIVFCLEAVDNGGRVFNIGLPREAELKADFEPDLLGGIMVIKARAQATVPTDWTNKLYKPPAPVKEIEMKAVPYCVWENRDPGEMVVWIPEAPEASQ